MGPCLLFVGRQNLNFNKCQLEGTAGLKAALTLTSYPFLNNVSIPISGLGLCLSLLHSHLTLPLKSPVTSSPIQVELSLLFSSLSNCRSYHYRRYFLPSLTEEYLALSLTGGCCAACGKYFAELLCMVNCTIH